MTTNRTPLQNIPAALQDLAAALDAQYKTRAYNFARRYELQADLQSLETLLIPEGGWPGKNNAERDLNRDQTYELDETHKKITQELRAIETKLIEIDGKIESISAHRRSLEWTVRSQLLMHLQGLETSHADLAESGFDHLIETEMDNEAINAAARPKDKWIDQDGNQAESVEDAINQSIPDEDIPF